MLLIGFVLITIINAQTLARTVTSQVPGTTKFPGQELPLFGPIYSPKLDRSFGITTMVPTGTTLGHTLDASSVTTTEKSIVPVTPSTEISNIEKSNSSSWWSNIFSSIMPTYQKMVSYTGPHLTPALLVTSVFGVIGTLVCVYTSICNTAFSGLNSTVYEASNHSSQYIMDNLNSPLFIPLVRDKQINDNVK